MKIDDERNKRNNSLEGIDEMTLVMVLSSMFWDVSQRFPPSECGGMGVGDKSR